jgi:hypothetical protein
VTGIPSFEWLDYAGTFLRDDAAVWYFNVIRNNRDWEAFKTTFLEEYEPLDAEDKASDDFFNLQQTGSVRDYETSFQKLTHRLPGITEDIKKRKFIAGLKPKMRNITSKGMQKDSH